VIGLISPNPSQALLLDLDMAALATSPQRAMSAADDLRELLGRTADGFDASGLSARSHRAISRFSMNSASSFLTIPGGVALGTQDAAPQDRVDRAPASVMVGNRGDRRAAWAPRPRAAANRAD